MNSLSTPSPDRRFRRLDPDVYNVGTEKLDAEEARKLLSTYLAAVTRRALKIVREQTEDKTAVLAKIRTCNEIIATLKGTLGEKEYNELQLDEQGGSVDSCVLQVEQHSCGQRYQNRTSRYTDRPKLFVHRCKVRAEYVIGVAKGNRDRRPDRLAGVIYQIQRASPAAGTA